MQTSSHITPVLKCTYFCWPSISVDAITCVYEIYVGLQHHKSHGLCLVALILYKCYILLIACYNSITVSTTAMCFAVEIKFLLIRYVHLIHSLYKSYRSVAVSIYKSCCLFPFLMCLYMYFACCQFLSNTICCREDNFFVKSHFSLHKIYLNLIGSFNI